jgi:ADP-dependent phosphofructokinase/glucokinase
MTHPYARETVAALVGAAPAAASRTIAMGFTANIDVLLAGGPGLTARMHQWCAMGTAEEAALWRAILEAQVQCASDGRGGEIALEPAAVLRRFDAFGHARTLGGTGVRAAAQAALLGQRSIVSVPAYDPLLASVLPERLVSLSPTPGSAGGASLPMHYVIEMPEALPDREMAHGPEHTRQPNRLIIHGDEPLSPLIPDSFIARLIESSPPVRMLLISGFNTYTTMTALEQALACAARQLRELKRLAPGLWIYLELAGFASPTALRRVLEAIGPDVDAVGMNEDECAAALDRFRAMAMTPPEAQHALMRDTLTHYGLARLVVHTAWMSSFLSRAPLRSNEQAVVARALALGNTAAGFRFASGRDGSRNDLRRAADAWTLSTSGLECAAAVEGHRNLVVVPAWDIRRGVGTVGLGDSFTGALLTGLDPPANGAP